MSRTTSALVVTRHGGPEVLSVQSLELPPPGTGEALIEVAAAGVNFIDVYRREGIYPVPTPFVSNTEGAGTVVEVGPDCDLTPGDRVAWSDVPGSAASHVVARASLVVPVPDEVGLETAAGVMLQGMTAHYLVRSTYPIQAGDTALVHAAAGGMGQLLVRWVTALGGRVLATASTDEKRAVATAAGAEAVFGYDDFVDGVRDVTDQRGVDVVYDGVGATTFDGSLASLRRRGTMVLFGGASGQVPPFDPQRLNSGGSLFLTRPKLADHTAERDELLWRAREVFAAVADGTLSVPIGGRFPLADAGRAYEELEGRRTTGKLLLIP
ncbi:MAG TPA: quinone oxidoreductase [Nocardioidaceae bacterium]|nr:quinone oxidoreductase [Nocardioidaceae bacterium]